MTQTEAQPPVIEDSKPDPNQELISKQRVFMSRRVEKVVRNRTANRDDHFADHGPSFAHLSRLQSQSQWS